MSDSLTNGKPADLVKERRRQIFEAAARVFTAKGFHSATVNEIAQEAGLGKGTIYEYVRSKKELLFLIIEEGHALLFDQIDKIEKMDIP
ncbi:MAG: TetR/AcrR family transcriptional regulator, partial [bacterium]